MTKLRIAVIGTGAMGASHIRVYSELDDAELVLICDKNEETVKELSKKYNVDYITDYTKIENVDAVSICVPTKFHKEVAMHFISKKIHVLVEKPIATTILEAKELVDAAKENNVKLMVGHIERFNPVVQEIKKRLLNKELGKIYDIKALRFSPFPHRVIDVGVTIDLAVHDIDVMLYITESKVKRIYAETARRIHANNEDLLNSLLKFDNGINGTIHTNWLTPKKVRELFITGEKGMFVAKYLTQELFFYKNKFTDKEFDYSKGVTTVIEGDMEKIHVKSKEPLKIELEEFINCIKEDRKPAVTGEQGINNLDIANKIIEAAEENKVISL